MTAINKQKGGNVCVFCSASEIKNRLILENDFVWAFPTNIPITQGHTLICTKRCVKNIEELTQEEWLSIFNVTKIVMKALRISHGAEGFNFAWNQGKLAGQSVQHLHLHVIPRKVGDNGLLGYDPRSMIYRTGDREPTPEDELLGVRDSIRNVIQ